jgi:hypothetical protein
LQRRGDRKEALAELDSNVFLPGLGDRFMRLLTGREPEFVCHVDEEVGHTSWNLFRLSIKLLSARWSGASRLHRHR